MWVSKRWPVGYIYPGPILLLKLYPYPHNHVHSPMHSWWFLSGYNWTVVTETICPTMLKIVHLWPCAGETWCLQLYNLMFSDCHTNSICCPSLASVNLYFYPWISMGITTGKEDGWNSMSNHQACFHSRMTQFISRLQEAKFIPILFLGLRPGWN